MVEMGAVVGVLTQAELFRALANDGQGILVGSIMDRNFETADSFEMLEPVMQRLQASQCSTIPVLRGGSLVGIVTTDNIGELLNIQSAMKPRNT